MGLWEWAGVAGGPVLIYLTRTAVTAFFNYRIDALSLRLKDQQADRAKTIQKLKDATRYDTTLELLEKYGGNEGKGKGKRQSVIEADKKQQQQQQQQQGNGHTKGPAGGRTNMPPPPTANIQRRDGPFPVQGSPPPRLDGAQGPRQPPNGLEPTEEFAPNAYAHLPPPPPTQSQHFAQGDGVAGSSHWYDRIMDLLLGEDETASKNRIVLICKSCRLVNGQAPPGTKALSELGTWKCMGCGAANGEMDEGRRIMQEVLGSRAGGSDEVPVGEEFKESDSDDSDADVVVKEEDKDEADEATATGRQGPAAGTKKRKGKGGR
ncbi:hypothetical protein LX36DRAFT_664187 [Colletotrichum falcatum]|nr:hypothetical protein LX36DRAFT_664187 [Colletotrichum falcatum]